MGFFSGQVIQESFDNVMVPDIKGYNDGYYSAKQAMVDNIMNEQAMFEGMIMTDIQESVMRINGANDGELIAFAENVITDVLDKIKEFLMKVWEKIKAIFRGWMAKLDSVMMKSNKEFVNKYRKVVLSKDLTDMKVTWRKPKANKSLANIHPFDIGATELENLKTHTHFDDAQTKMEKWDEDDELCKLLVKCLDANTLTDSKDFEKEFIDEYLEDEEEDDNVGKDINGIMAELLSFKDTKKGLDKGTKSLEKAIKAMIKEIEKDQNDVIKASPGEHENIDKDHPNRGFVSKTSNNAEIKHKEYGYSKSGDNWESNTKTVGNKIAGGDKGTPYTISGEWSEEKDPIRKYQKAIQVVYKYALLHQRAANMYTSAIMKLCKLWNAGNRKVWAAAVAYSRKEEAVMTEAMLEIAYDSEILF